MSNKMPPQPPPQRFQPLQERLASRQSAMNIPMACPKCGSTFFLETNANQYNNAGYGSAEFRRISVSTFTVRVCLCGWPVGPQMQAGSFGAAGTEVNAFHESLEAAHRYRETNSVDGIIQQVATRKDVENLASQVSEVASEVDRLSEKQHGEVSTPDHIDAEPASTTDAVTPTTNTPNEEKPVIAAAARKPKKK